MSPDMAYHWKKQHGLTESQLPRGWRGLPVSYYYCETLWCNTAKCPNVIKKKTHKHRCIQRLLRTGSLLLATHSNDMLQAEYNK